MQDKEDQQQTDLPTVNQVTKFLVRPGTVLGKLEYPGKPIIFSNSSQQAVKSLAVTIKSTETSKMAALHFLHTQTRTI